jgi:hypothetical protein
VRDKRQGVRTRKARSLDRKRAYVRDVRTPEGRLAREKKHTSVRDIRTLEASIPRGANNPQMLEISMKKCCSIHEKSLDIDNEFS